MSYSKFSQATFFHSFIFVVPIFVVPDNFYEKYGMFIRESRVALTAVAVVYSPLTSGTSGVLVRFLDSHE